ncbi:MAG: hypothetical protein MUE96_02335 [Bacteroidia bacterium]|nr:hypothetical protein [Bacteroidia bacterium]
MNMEMNETQALQLIEQMIGSAKREAKDNGFYYLLWGWMVFAGALIDYFLLIGLIPSLQEKHALVWAILMPIAGVISMIGGMMESKKISKVRTYVDELMRYVVWAFSISLFVVCIVMPATSNWPSFYPVLMLLYAIWLFISGGALRFTPLVYGGIFNWACAFAAFFADYDVQLLILAAAVFAGYIIPGYLLQRNFAKHV